MKTAPDQPHPIFYSMQSQNTELKPPKKKTGLSRILVAFSYSMNGLRCTLSTEAAFRQEVCLTVIAVVVLFFLPLSHEWKALLFLATTAVLVVELLNSAIESVVDLVSTEYHVLAKRAKDIGSAAVFVSLTLAVILWSGAVVSIIIAQSR